MLVEEKTMITASDFYTASDTSITCTVCNTANRLYGQRIGAFLWCPVLWPFQEDRPIPTRPTQSCALDGGVIGCHQCITSHSANSPVSSDMRPTPMALSRIHTIKNLHHFPQVRSPQLHSAFTLRIVSSFVLGMFQPYRRWEFQPSYNYG